MHSPLYVFHNLIVLSLDPEAKYFFFSDNTMLFTAPRWPLRVLMSFPLEKFHNPIVPSADPDAKLSPDKITLFTHPK